MMAAVLLHTVLCIALFWASYCRAVHTSRRTRPVIRAAICVQASASLGAGAAPWLSGYRPEWPAIVLLASMVLVQAATSLLWRAGVPRQFDRSTSVADSVLDDVVRS
jgi:hypothetical protein